MCSAQPLNIHLSNRFSGDFQLSANISEGARRVPVWSEAPDIPALPPDILPNIGIFDCNNSKKEPLNLTQVTTLCVDGVLFSSNCDNEGVSLALWLDVSVDEMSVPTLSSNGDSTASVDWSTLDSTRK